MNEFAFSPSLLLLAINCAVGSMAACLVGCLVLVGARRQGPSRQHSVLALACVFAIGMPAMQCVLFVKDFGWIEVQQAQAVGRAAVNDSSPRSAEGSEGQIRGTLSSIAESPLGHTFILVPWALGTLLMLGWLGVRLLTLRRIRRTLEPSKSQRELNAITAAAEHVGINVPKLATTNARVGPMVIGWRDPTVVIPNALSARFTDQQLRCVLVHECEHIRRGDILWTMCAELARCVYWWNPLVIWILQKMECLRERACDDRVAGLGIHARHYI